MYYRTETLVCIPRNEYCLLYVGTCRQVGKIEIGVKLLRSGGAAFAPKSATLLPAVDVEGINYEYNRLFEKATSQGYAPLWQCPAQIINGRQLQLAFF